METYKYVIFLCFFIFSCEKNNSINSLEPVQLCNESSFDKATLSVLSFNRMSGTSLNSISEVIESTDPDIIGLQESYNMGLKIANRFDYCYYGDDYNSTAILSKYPIEFVNEIYFKIILNESTYINFFNIHFTSEPYQPYDIRDMLITTPLQAVYQAEQTRGSEADFLVSSIMSARSDNNMPIIVTGDFNEPSHLDWILGAENPVSFSLNNNTQFIVNWPISDKMFNVDMVDVYRYLYPDPIQQNGYTWTPNISLGEVHDRIDFIYCDTNDLIDINNIHIVGPDPLSDISVDNYESDHRGVFAIFNINNSIL